MQVLQVLAYESQKEVFRRIMDRPERKVKGICLACGKPIEGRKGKRFCNTNCYKGHFRPQFTSQIRKDRYDWFLKLKSEPCSDCWQKFDPVCMDWDHARGEKKYSISVTWRDGDIEKVKKELEKCDLVCSNCHRIRTYSRKVGQSKYALSDYSHRKFSIRNSGDARVVPGPC